LAAPLPENEPIMTQPDKGVSGESIVTVTQVQISCEVNGEAVILHFDSGNYFGLNDVGTLVWRMIDQPRSVRELRDAILREYEVEPEQCERDLLDLLGELRECGLIEVRD
jgi:hypothetical protein